MMGSHPMGEGLELGGHDHDRRLVQALDEDGVVDTPRRARASIAQTHDAALDEARPLVEIGSGRRALGADAVTSDEGPDVGAVGAQPLLPHLDHGEVGAP